MQISDTIDDADMADNQSHSKHDDDDDDDNDDDDDDDDNDDDNKNKVKITIAFKILSQFFFKQFNSNFLKNLILKYIHIFSQQQKTTASDDLPREIDTTTNNETINQELRWIFG